VQAADLLRIVQTIAVASLLARFWPGSGAKHDAALPIAGLFLSAGWEEGEAAELVFLASRAAGHEKPQDRKAVVHDTYRKARTGQPTSGIPKLKDYLPEEIVSTLYKWCVEISPNPPKPHVSEEGDDKRGPSQATKLVKLADDAVFFHTPDQEAWATITANDHQEHWPLKIKAFRRWLARRFYEQEKKTPSAQALQDALGVLEGKALFGSDEYSVFTRIADHSDMLYLDLANDRWEAIAISSRGWRVVQNAPVRFRRTKGMLPLPIPVAGGAVVQLKPFVNTRSEEDWILLVAWLLMVYSPRGPYPVLDLTGEQGSAKSTRARVLRSLVDPSSAPLRTAPREERDLMISAQSSWVLAFDNLSHLPQWLSDAFCRLATGGGLSTRELYSDAEEVLFDAQRPVLFTGIEDVAVSGDLLDRSIRLSLPTIPDKQRKPESLLWREFEAVRPRLLGALLNVVSAALRNQSNVNLDRLPRMADFALWVTAAESALGWKAGTFLSVYSQNRETANELALEGSLVAAPVKTLVEKGPWEGTAKELLDILTAPLSEKDAKAKDWPKTPLTLSNVLRRLAPNLRAAGIETTFLRAPGKRSRLIRLDKQSSDARDASDAARENTEYSASFLASLPGLASLESDAATQQNSSENKPCVDSVDSVDEMPLYSNDSDGWETSEHGESISDEEQSAWNAGIEDKDVL
jgi:hypothetical protein